MTLYRDGVQISSKPLQPNFENDHFVCLFVVTPPLPRDGGTAIQVHAVNLIEISLGER